MFIFNISNSSSNNIVAFIFNSIISNHSINLKQNPTTYKIPTFIFVRFKFANTDVFPENLISQNAHNSYQYAYCMLKGPFSLGEPIIATDMFCSYHYARVVLCSRFELGEPLIATEINYAYCYAKFVIKGRFELGEEVIFSDDKMSSLYKQLLIDVSNNKPSHLTLF